MYKRQPPARTQDQPQQAEAIRKPASPRRAKAPKPAKPVRDSSASAKKTGRAARPRPDAAGGRGKAATRMALPDIRVPGVSLQAAPTTRAKGSKRR